MPASKGGGGGAEGQRPPPHVHHPVVASLAAQEAPQHPSTPTRTPSKSTNGMVLRSGFTPGSARTPRSLRRTGHMEEFSSLFGGDFSSDDILGDMSIVPPGGEPELLENFMAELGDMHAGNTLFFGNSPRRSSAHAAAASAAAAQQGGAGAQGVSAAEAQLQGQQFTGAGLSPVLAGKIMSPGIDLARLRRPTGYTPQLGRGHPSPRLGPFPSPRPSNYQLRSASQSPASGYTPKHSDVTPFGLVDGGFVTDSYFNKPHSSAKRPLLTEAQLQLFASPGPGQKKSSTFYDSEDGTRGPPSGNASAKKQRREKKEKADRRTATAPKRGEYRCGKCGFFPKKAKHNCSVEKAKRQAAGGAVTAGGGSSVARTDAKTSVRPTGDKPAEAPKVADPVLSAYNSGPWQ